MCAKYLAPVIGHLACEDIKAADMQAAVDAAPTAGEGDRVRRCVSALVNVGIVGGYLPTGEPRDDSDIARTIAHILDNTQIPEGNVHAQVRAGRVTLNGEVEWQYQRLEVERMVRTCAAW